MVEFSSGGNESGANLLGAKVRWCSRVGAKCLVQKNIGGKIWTPLRIYVSPCHTDGHVIRNYSTIYTYIKAIVPANNSKNDSLMR